MTHRSPRRADGTASRRTSDPFVALYADRAWRADEAVDNGSVTTSIANYIGPHLPLVALGTGQAIKARSANFANRPSIAFNGLSASNGYAAVALSAAPVSFSMASVIRLTSTNRGIAALTVGGTVNTGVSHLLDISNVQSRKLGTGPNVAVTLPARVVVLSVFTSAGITSYVNTRTAVTSATAGALAGTKMAIGVHEDTGVITLAGEWVTTGYWTRALTPAEAKACVQMLGALYRIAIA